MKRFLGLLAMGALAACSAPAAVDSVSQAIVNGSTDNADPAVVMVLAHMPGSQNASLCTGEIVSPHVVLTAAHCLDPALVGTGSVFNVFTGTTPNASTSMAVKETHFNASFDNMNPQNGNDVGVLILATPTTVAPVGYNRAPMPQSMVGSAARLVGYGITMVPDTMPSSAGTKREAPTTLAHLDTQFVGLQDGSHGICEGDSGGPAFMMFGGTERIAGITSFGFTNCPLTPPAGTPSGFEAGNDTRIDTYADFIDQWVLMFDPPAKGPGAMCTSDSDCTPRACEQTSVGKICAQSCDPAAMPPTCPTGTMCTNVDGSNLCVSAAAMGGGGKGGGCDVAGGRVPVAGAALLLGVWLALALRRRAR
ncbi:MAG TPA: trypsin-like serine protease [Polyangia bacterium]